MSGQKIRLRFRRQALTQIIDRPVGLDYTVPDYGVAYNYGNDIPVGSLRYDTGNAGGAFSDIAAAITAARAANKALLLPPGTYTGDSVMKSNMLPIGIYAEGPLGSVIVKFTGTLTNTTPCFGYMYDRNFTCKGVEFQNFGDVFGFCVGSVARAPASTYAYHTSTATAFARGMPNGTIKGAVTGVGVEIDTATYPKTIGTMAGTWDVTDNRFTNCQRAIFGVSDTVTHGYINFHRNESPGSWGGVDMRTTYLSRVFAVNNKWWNGGECLISNGSPCVVTTEEAHSFAANDTVRLIPDVDIDPVTINATTKSLLPDPLVRGTAYFVRNPTTYTFELSLTSGGASINTTTVGHGTFGWSRAARELPSANTAQGMHTYLCLGTNVTEVSDVRSLEPVIDVANNEAHHWLDQGSTDDTNASVFTDIRNPNCSVFDAALLTCNFNIRYNRCKRLQSTQGQSDCNPIYTKPGVSLIIEGNDIYGCGGHNSKLDLPQGHGTGAECTGTIMKSGYGCDTATTYAPGAFFAFINNKYRKMPLNDSALRDRVLLKTSDTYTPDVFIIANKAYDCQITTIGGNCFFKILGITGKVKYWLQELHNCPTVDQIFLLHDWVRTGTVGGDHEFSNSDAYWGVDVDYVADATKITSDQNSSALIVTGHNVLHGSGGDFVNRYSSTGTLGAGLRTYTPPTVSV
jgi:hypothetical protein